MCAHLYIRLPLAVMLGVGACEAWAQDPPVAPPEDAASAPAEPVATPPDNTIGAISERIETTLDSWQEFLDELLLDAFGPNPERRYRVFGQRKTVDLGKRWEVSTILLHWENAHATAYRVEVSTDGRQWKQVYSTADGQGGDVTVQVPKLPVQQVRMYGTKRSTDYGFSLLDVEVR
jgi:hypothetical protein